MSNPLPPPDILPSLVARYGTTAYLGIYEEGDYNTFALDNPEWSRGYVAVRGGRMFLGADEIDLSDLPGRLHTTLPTAEVF